MTVWLRALHRLRRSGTGWARMAFRRSLVPIARHSVLAAVMAARLRMPRGVSIMAQMGIAPEAVAMSAALSTLGSRMASGAAARTAWRSALPGAEAGGLMRTTTSRPPQSFTAAQTATRAASLACGATESSRSSTTTSHGRVRAFSSMRLLEPGTKSTERLGLNAFDKDEFAFARLVAIFARLGVFRRMVAVVGVLQRGEFDHHIAGAGHPFQHFGLAAARQELGVVAGKGRLGGLDIGFVGFRVVNIHPRDPVS